MLPPAPGPPLRGCQPLAVASALFALRRAEGTPVVAKVLRHGHTAWLWLASFALAWAAGASRRRSGTTSAARTARRYPQGPIRPNFRLFEGSQAVAQVPPQ